VWLSAATPEMHLAGRVIDVANSWAFDELVLAIEPVVPASQITLGALTQQCHVA
jgi:hypothetical protein